MNPSPDQLRKACAAWSLNTDGKAEIEVEALFWKAVCERLLCQQMPKDRVASALDLFINPFLSETTIYLDPKLVAEWTQEHVV